VSRGTLPSVALPRTALAPPVLATEACQVPSADGDSGHVVLRLMGGFIVLYPTRVLCTGEMTMEEIGFRLKHDGRLVASEALA
jgi:hypothetical protein